MANYIFSTGSARGGTGLLTRMLSVSQEVEIALDPYLELYRSFRSAIVDHNATDELKQQYDHAAPFQDYYYSDYHREILNLIQNSSMDLPFDREKAKKENLFDILSKRSLFSSGDLSTRVILSLNLVLVV